MQIFSLLVDFTTGNPDAWLNWYGPTDEIGKVYKQPLTGDYFVIIDQITRQLYLQRIMMGNRIMEMKLVEP